MQVLPLGQTPPSYAITFKGTKADYDKLTANCQPAGPTQQTITKVKDITIWEGSKLTAQIIEQFKGLVKKEEWPAAYKLHNELALSPLKYCCSKHKKIIKRNLEIYVTGK